MKLIVPAASLIARSFTEKDGRSSSARIPPGPLTEPSSLMVQTPCGSPIFAAVALERSRLKDSLDESVDSKIASCAIGTVTDLVASAAAKVSVPVVAV